MIIKTKYRLDLLRKRREDANSSRLIFSNTKKLRKRGFLYGVLITSLGLSICAWTSFQTFRSFNYKKKLVIEANEYELLKTKYNQRLNNLKSIYKINNQISQGIIGIKSGSALLLEIKEKLPKTIQLVSINSKDKKLVLKGRANQPFALSSINSLELQLLNSFIIEDKSVFLSRAWESRTNKQSYLNFTLSSKFSTPSFEELSVNYEKLGSLGLFKRVNLLKQEGLIK